MNFTQLRKLVAGAVIALLMHALGFAQPLSTQASAPASAVPPSPNLRANIVQIQKEELSIVQTILQIAGGLFSTMAVVFAAIVGVNVYQGSVVLKDARSELNAAKEEMLALRKAKLEYEALISSKVSVDAMVESAIAAIRNEAKATYEESVRQLYRNSKVVAYIREAKEELTNDNPSEEYLYPRVTATFGYLDPDVLDLFKTCMERLPKDSEVVRAIFKHGFHTLQSDHSIQRVQHKSNAA